MSTAWVKARSLLLATIIAGSIAATAPAARASGTSTISGTVFQDLNRNGVQDPGEAGFANVSVFLYDSSGTGRMTVYTDANGNYTFGGLADGTYRLTLAPSYWSGLENNWVPTTHPAPGPGYLDPQVSVSLSGIATANIALRPIVRSSSPITTFTAPGGTVVNSFDDAVAASDVAAALAGNALFGAERPLTTIDFDEASSYTSTNVSGVPGSYFGYQATVDIRYMDWVDRFDFPLSYEYGHAWSEYYMDIVQQDPTLTSYLQARGLSGNPNLGTSQMWAPLELIADDYRQLFGTPNAQSYPPFNYQIPPASQVAGLKTFLASTFMIPPYRQPAPTVAFVTPAAGPAPGGTSVTITGTNFTGSGWAVMGVLFGGVAASRYSVSSPTEIVAVAPAGSGQVDVTVATAATSDGAVETSATGGGDLYAYAPVPTVAGISPAKGTMKGGTSVTITGSGFSGAGYAATSVSFGGVSARFSVSSPTTIVAVSPPSKAQQTVAVAVATPGGTATGGSFSYTRR